jgi:hypothetical protein
VKINRPELENLALETTRAVFLQVKESPTPGAAVYNRILSALLKAADGEQPEAVEPTHMPSEGMPTGGMG